jgi:uncharacterized BrkB/YihY/UPF0761 family membrane protein
MANHIGHLKVPAVCLESTFLLILGLLLGGFGLLQVHQHYLGLPSVSLTLSYWLASFWPSTAQTPGSEAIQRIWLGVILIVAWLCWVGAVSRLSRLVSRVYRSSLAKRPQWLTVLYHWGLTVVVLAAVNILLYWIGPDALIPVTADELRLKTAEGTPVGLTWQTTVWHVVRWPVAIATVGLALGIFYRLSPQRWQRGAPLWPGIGLSLLLGGLGVASGIFLLEQINQQNLTYGIVLQVALIFVGLLGLVLLIPLGAQFNVSLVNQNQVSMPSGGPQRITAPPPSFDSFKINRGPGDHFRE